MAKVNGAATARKKSAGFFLRGALEIRKPRVRQGRPEFISLETPGRDIFFGQMREISIIFSLENPSGNFSQEGAGAKYNKYSLVTG